MRNIEYFDPYEANTKDYEFSDPHKINIKTDDPIVVEMWETIMRRVVDKRSKKVVIGPPDTISLSFAKKILEFMNDEDHIKAKFDEEPPKAMDIYKAAKFSKSKWGRIMSGEMLDIERGNAFAVAIALRLNTEQTEELLYSAGFAINYELDLDAAMMYFIKKEFYNMDFICSVLSSFSNIKNGLDCFIFQPRISKQQP